MRLCIRKQTAEPPQLDIVKGWLARDLDDVAAAGDAFSERASGVVSMRVDCGRDDRHRGTGSAKARFHHVATEDSVAFGDASDGLEGEGMVNLTRRAIATNVW